MSCEVGQASSRFGSRFLTLPPGTSSSLSVGGLTPAWRTPSLLFSQLGGDGLRHCILVEYDEGENSPSRKHDNSISANVRAIEELFKNSGELTTRQIRMWSDDGRRRVGSRGAAGVFASAEAIESYTDILVDISALPRSLYMPMLARLLNLVDQMPDVKRPNLHVVVGDNPALDQLIVAELNRKLQPTPQRFGCLSWVRARLDTLSA